jgi:hypothetical protein
MPRSRPFTPRRLLQEAAIGNRFAQRALRAGQLRLRGARVWIANRRIDPCMQHLRRWHVHVIEAERAQAIVQCPRRRVRIRTQRVVVDDQPRPTATRFERVSRVALPQGERLDRRETITCGERSGDRERVAHDVHEQRSREQRQQFAREQAQTRLLEQPRPPRVELVDERADFTSERIDRGSRVDRRR